MRDAFEAGACVAVTEARWNQATLPPSEGGIGISSETDLALPCFLASVSLTNELAGSLCQGIRDETFETAKSMWVARTGLKLPAETSNSKTRFWSSPLYSLKAATLKDSAQTPEEVARLRAAATDELAVLFTAVPSTKDGTTLDSLILPSRQLSPYVWVHRWRRQLSANAALISILLEITRSLVA